MIHSLQLRLTLFFLAVALVPALIMFLTASTTRTNEFQSLIVQQETALLADTIRAYYTDTGSLAGFYTYLRSPSDADRRLRRSDYRDDADHRMLRSLGVADASGQVLLPSNIYQLGTWVSPTVLPRSTPVLVEHTPVAFILPPQENLPFPLRVEEQLYLERTNRALLLATGGAMLAAVLLGAVFARTLTRPIRDLTLAADALRRGSLDEQVPIRSHDELGHLAFTFNQMSADLARATHTRRQMTSDIAHDLRTPLQVIGGYVEAMAAGDLEPTRARLTTVYAEIEHLQRLVADLRMLSQADAGDLPLSRQAVSPQAVLARVAAAYAVQAAQQEIILTVSAQPDLPLLWIDEDRLLQVLNNLLSNALRYTPAGGRITLLAFAQAGGVCLQVQDTGAGITADDLPYVFERFYRGDRARTDDTAASGLGLAIAKALVELHGGTITVASLGAGAGAILTIWLPVGIPDCQEA